MADMGVREEEDSLTDSLRDKYLTFLVEREQYGIEIKYVTEIIGIQLITEVPQMPDYIRGVINLRGTIIPVMDVRIRFGKPPKAYSDRTCVIVIELGDLAIGLIVDSVSEVLSIDTADIVPPPELYDGGNRFVAGIGKAGSAVMLLLDCNRLLNEQEIAVDSIIMN
ncbi:chemotaxis protein CheW [Paenibacillus macerans]|uniref:chemotaxis protein CheW n=1 Tax=Paenibacillus macerans TaxID=44252 RepID=UPI003D312D50